MAISRRSLASVPLLPFQWNQGEHMVAVGSTGTGKTTLMAQLLRARRAVISLVTKADDSNLLLPNDVPRNRHIRHVADIKNDPNRNYYVLEPHLREQRAEGYAVYNRVWREGFWTLYTDELYYADHMLKLGDLNTMLLTQGRSKKITVVNGVQRPAWVSRFALAEPTHVVVGQLRDPRDVKTIVEATTPALKRPLESLKKYEFLWYHRGDNRWAVISFDRINGGESSEE